MLEATCGFRQQIRRTHDWWWAADSYYIYTNTYIAVAVQRRQLAFLEARACLPTEALRLAQRVHETWNLQRSSFDEVRVTSHNRCLLRSCSIHAGCGHPDALRVRRRRASSKAHSIPARADQCSLTAAPIGPMVQRDVSCTWAAQSRLCARSE